MASGMGIPSISIYAYELYNFYNVENIIRIGTAGGVREDVHVRDIVFAMSAYTDSNFGRQYGFDGNVAPCCSFDLLVKAREAAEKIGVNPKIGPMFTSDVFYNESNNTMLLKKLGILAVEMESAGLYLNAARAKKNALAICTISDDMNTGEALSAEDHQTTFTQMMEIALEIA